MAAFALRASLCRQTALSGIRSQVTRSLTTRSSQSISSIRGAHDVASSRGSFDLVAHMRRRIQVMGPLTTADYMQELLTNPASSYYAKDNTLGSHGDFITAPEMSQLFGESIAVWLLSQWHDAGAPSNIRLIELGPGRGTLARDILKVLRSRGAIPNEVHLIESSKELSEVQHNTLCGGHPMTTHKSEAETYASAALQGSGQAFWHRHLECVPKSSDAYTMLVANEFFDALPVHQIQKTDRGWRERLVDFDEACAGENNPGFRMVLAPEPTPVSKLVEEKYQGVDHRDGTVVEMSTEAVRLAKLVGQCMEQGLGGTGLIIDYGKLDSLGDTLRSFRSHKSVDIFDKPGSSDITADVDFSTIIEAIRSTSPHVGTWGPITQRQFLDRLLIGVRMQQLIAKRPELKDKLMFQVAYLTSPKRMGERFKVLALQRHNASDKAPHAFGSELTAGQTRVK